MSRVEIYVHVVWGTKHRNKILIKKARGLLFNHIEENAKLKSIEIISINGYLDHVHCLIRLRPDQNIGNIVQLLKGEASFWANKNNLFSDKLVWAQDYYAASISESDLGTAKAYLCAQESHHRNNNTDEKHEIPINDDD